MQRYTDRALAFVRRAAERKRPFFLYLAPNAPHVPLYPSAGFAGKSRRGVYGDVVEELDAAVGEILGALAARGLERDTLVIFTSDNGPWLAMRELGGSAGGLRGGKTGTFEGGHRVPALARWPAAIPPGREAHEPATMMDWLPTIAELAGAPLPADRTIDGRSLARVLAGTGAREPTPFFYLRLRLPFGEQAYEIGAVREGRYKLALAQRGFYPALLEPILLNELQGYRQQLFDLEADPGEQRDVAGEHPDVVAGLLRSIASFEATLDPAPPVRVVALPDDHHGWEKLAKGAAIAAAIILGAALALLYVLVRGARWAVRRARS